MNALAGALALTLVAENGAAQLIDIAPAPLGRALVALAAQLHVSFGGEVQACGGAQRSLQGRFTPEQAFERLARGSGCRIVKVDRRTWVALPAPRPKPVAKPPEPPKPPLPPRASARGAEAPVSEVLVTAGRRATELATYAGSSTILEEPGLGDAAHRSLQQLGRNISVLESTNLGPGRDKLFLRGLSDGTFSGSTASTVALYLDDLPISYNAPDPDLRLADIERVEVLAGPQGALFGAGAIGGVVRLIPRAPDLATSEGAVATGISNVAHGGLGGDVEATVNLPVIKDRFGLRAVVYRESQPGYIDDLGLGVHDVNATVRQGGRLAALLQLTSDWSASATVAYQDIDSNSSQYVVRGGPALSRTTRTPTPQDNDFGVLSATLSGPLPFASLRLSAALVRHTAVTTYDATPAEGLFDEEASEPASYDETHRRLLAVGEALLTSPAGGRAAWSAGAFLAHATDDSRERLAAGLSAPLLFREDRRDQLDEAALFGEIVYRPFSKLALRAGLRVFRSTLVVDAREQQPVFGTASTYAGDVTTIDASPKIQLELQAFSHLLAYASFATGYRPVGLNTSGPPGVAFGPGGETRVIHSDTARTYETGARWAAGPTYLRGAIFYTDWLGIQSDQFSPYGLPMAVNIGDGAVFGAQLEGGFPLPAGVLVQGSLILADQSLTADRSPTFPSRADAGLPGVAPVNGAFSLTWMRQFGPFSLSSSLQARYVGSSRLTFSAAQVGRMGDYWDDALETSLSRGSWSLAAAVENLTDQRPNTFAFGDPFLPASVQQATPLRPRTLTVTLRHSF